MPMFGNMGGLRPLPNGMLAGPGFPDSPGAPIGGGQLTPLSNGLLAGPGFPTPGEPPPFIPSPAPAAAPAPTPAMPAVTPMAASQPTGMFAGLSRGQVIAGLIGDALQKASGGQGTFMPIAVQHQQNAEIMRRQAAQFSRQVALEAWKREHPEPGSPHYWQTNDGSLAVLDPATGKPTIAYQDPTPKTTWLTADNGDGTKQIIPMTANGPAGAGAAPAGGAALPPGYTVRPKGGAASGPRTFPAEAAYDAIVQHESGGRAGVTGPQTRYGRAQGLSQMLPKTAEAMAARLNLPWRPDLMTATSDVAAQYQRALGRAYFEEGLSKTGNVHDAAQYYHAGPDTRLWGPKTRAYADRVVASLEA